MGKKFLVTDTDDGEVPFLRGILVRSLVNSGLCFEDAYQVADALRDRFHDEQRVPREVLRAAAAALVAERFGKTARDRYQAPPLLCPAVSVHTGSRAMPFSETYLIHSLEACSIEPAAARRGAHVVHLMLRRGGRRHIDSDELRGLVARCLMRHVSPEATRRYLAWRRFKASGTPLILLIGGITGVGKSTMATELGYRLGVVRTQSTDIMREIIRAMLPPHLYPSLGFSSFEAWRGLPEAEGGPSEDGTGRVVEGFLNQFAAVKIALEAALRRASVERQDLILEGVHVLPNRLRLKQATRHGLVVSIMLAKVGRKALRRQLEYRARREPGRTAERYLAAFDSICELQSFLLDEADRADIGILVNDDLDRTVAEALQVITEQVMERFPIALEGELEVAEVEALEPVKSPADASASPR